MSSALSRLLVYLLSFLGIKVVTKTPVRAFLTVRLPFPKGAFLKGGRMILPVGETVIAAVTVDDAQGDVLTTLATPPVWSSSDPTIATATAAADGLTAKVKGLKLGDVVITSVVTTNPDGTPKVSTTGSVSVTPGEPASASMSFGTPFIDNSTPNAAPKGPA